MTLGTNQHNHIGMAFEPPALYVPPRLHGSNIAYLHTVLPVPDGATFDYRLNGAPGTVAGLSVFHYPTVIGVYVDDRFLQAYAGPWPAVMEVRCLQHGQPVDLARVPLLDTRTAVPVHLRVDVSGSPVTVPPSGARAVVQTSPRVSDADLIPLPFLYGSTIQLLNPGPGIEQQGHTFIVTDKAELGTYRVRVTTTWGLEQTVTFEVVANAPA